MQKQIQIKELKELISNFNELVDMMIIIHLNKYYKFINGWDYGFTQFHCAVIGSIIR